MRFYLEWVNPVIALLILAICSWIYLGGYFVSFGQEKSAFAKGLFCSSALFLMGEILKRLLEKKKQT